MSLNSSDIDQTIRAALMSVSQAMQTSTEEGLAAHGALLATSEKLWEWVDQEVTTDDGVCLTRDEFRRRLESERARHAGHAERLQLSASCQKLEQMVLGANFELAIEGSIEPSGASIF